jgi:hypothetical protein
VFHQMNQMGDTRRNPIDSRYPPNHFVQAGVWLAPDDDCSLTPDRRFAGVERQLLEDTPGLLSKSCNIRTAHPRNHFPAMDRTKVQRGVMVITPVDGPH